MIISKQYIISQIVNFFIFMTISLWFFFLIFDTFVYLQPNQVSWFGIDNTTSYIAQLFFISDGWHFPLLRNPLYGQELSTSLSFTGPSPILVLPMKLFGINPEYQFFGLWILLNILLQLYMGARLLRTLGCSVNFSRVFSTFFITPFLIVKIQSHFWLISHYLILWGLCILFKYLMKGKFEIWEASLILCISYLTNIYLVVMVSLILVLIYLLKVFSPVRNFSRTFHEFFIPFSVLAVIFVFFDSIDFQENTYQTAKMFLSPTYGYHGFNLLTFINPDTGFVAEGVEDSWDNLPLFSMFPLTLGMIPGAYEGFMYLGLGLVLLLLTMTLFRKKFICIFQNYLNKVQRKLIIFFVSAILLFAVSYRIGVGSLTFVLPFPVYLDWFFGFLRSSGRFMWPIAYALIGILLTKFSRTLVISLERKSISLVLLTLFMIQQVDISVPLVRQNREIIMTDIESDFESEPISLVTKSLKSYKLIRAYPQGDFLENHYSELNYLAWKMGISTDLHFTSRINMLALYRRESETYSDICLGRFRPFVAYAVSNDNLVDFSSCPAKLVPVFKGQFHTFFGTTA